MPEAKIIKRYANRKLYDTERSCYVTLDDIAVMIRAGEEVRVIDNRSGNDLTSVTLAQIIFEAEKKANFMPMELLTKLIRNSGDRLGAVTREQLDTLQSKAQHWSGEATERASEFTRKASEVKHQVEGVIHKTRSTLDELQHEIEHKVKSRVGTISDTMSREMNDITKRLKELKDRLEKND